MLPRWAALRCILAGLAAADRLRCIHRFTAALGGRPAPTANHFQEPVRIFASMRLRGWWCKLPVAGSAAAWWRWCINACTAGMGTGCSCCRRRCTTSSRRCIRPTRCGTQCAKRWTCRRSCRPVKRHGASRPTLRRCCCTPAAAGSMRHTAAPRAARSARTSWRWAGCSGRTSAPSAISASVSAGRWGCSARFCSCAARRAWRGWAMWRWMAPGSRPTGAGPRPHRPQTPQAGRRPDLIPHRPPPRATPARSDV